MKSKIKYFVGPLMLLAVACGENTSDDSTQNIPTTAGATNQSTGYQVLNIYPHHAETFTEGLFLKGDTVYESAGENGKSKLLVYQLSTGKILQSTNLDAAYFGEGISELNGKIYQLTYKKHKVFVYDAKTLKKIQERTWPYEGWGMTTDGKQLLVSTGSSHIYFVNPADFQITKTISVSNSYGPLSMVNELEYVDGFIYANVWQTDNIVKIDPASGQVVATIDIKGIRENNGVAPTGDWLNGIAYDPQKKTFLITGKHWTKTFEVRFK